MVVILFSLTTFRSYKMAAGHIQHLLNPLGSYSPIRGLLPLNFRSKQ